MPLPLLLLKIDKVIGFVQLGIATYQNIVQAIRNRQVRVDDLDGKELTAEEVEARCKAAQLQTLKTGDAAAGRIDARPRGDVTGDP